MKKRKIKGTTVFAAAILSIVLLLSAVQTVAFDKNFYHTQQKELNIAEDMHTTEEDLTAMMNALLDYCSGKREDIAVTVSVDGQPRPAFDERETQHMVDVRALYKTAMTVRNVLLVLVAIIMAYALVFRKSGMVNFLLDVVFGLILGTAVIAVIGVVAGYNFSWFWTTFHQLVFTNDLWLLDPAHSLMINLLPSELFFALVMRVIMVFAASVLFIMVGIIIAIFFIKRRDRRSAER